MSIEARRERGRKKICSNANGHLETADAVCGFNIISHPERETHTVCYILNPQHDEQGYRPIGVTG